MLVLLEGANQVQERVDRDVAALDCLPEGDENGAAGSAGVAGVQAVAKAPTGEALKLKPIRIGLYDQYGGSMPSGWTRWLFEQYEFPFEIIYPKALDAGNLASRYDVIVLPSGAIPAREGQTRGYFDMIDSSNVPAEYRDRLGRASIARTVPQLRQFLEAGGTVVAVGTSANLGIHLGLPIASALVEKTASGTERELPADKFYVPGSVLRVQVDTTRPVSFGMPRDVDVFYDNSPAFRLGVDAAAKGVKPIAWFANGTPRRSGWAWGQSSLDGAVEALEAPIGKGTLYLFAPEITFRGQPHGTFKWLFNGIYAPREPAIVP